MSFLKYQKQSPEFLTNFLKYKRFIECRAETTTDELYFDLRTLLRYIKLYLNDKDKLKAITKDEFKTIDISDISIQDLKKINRFALENYIIFLANILQNDAKTRNRKLASCKRLFEYLVTNNLINLNPAKSLSSARVEKRTPKYLNLNECKKLLSVTINSEQIYKIRNYAITCIFLNCSIRLSELTRINLTDIKLINNDRTILIHGKGNKERLLYLNAAVCEAINTYLQVRPKLGKEFKDHNALFLSSRNKRISNRTVETIIKENLSKTINENKDIRDFKTHTLRHSGASLLYNEGNTDIFILKKILGHTCLNATEIYTHISNKKLKEIMMNCTISSILERNGGKINEQNSNT